MNYLKNRKFSSLRWQLTFILSSLLILLGGSVTTTILDANHHDQDFTAIHLSAQQHRLVHQLVLGVAIPQQDFEQASLIEQIDNNLFKLRYGGRVETMSGHIVVLLAAKDEPILAQLDEVENRWSLFQTHLEESGHVLLTEGSGNVEAERALQAEAEALLSALDGLGEILEEKSYINTIRIQQFHVGLLVIAVFLLVLGISITREQIVRPLSMLTTAAQKFAQGEKSAPVSINTRAAEVEQLVSAFNFMQNEIEKAYMQLENRLAQRTKELTAVFEISQEVVRQQEIDKVLEMVTWQTKSSLNAAATHLCLIDVNQSLVKLVSRSGTVLNDPEYTFQTRFPHHMIELDNAKTSPTPCLGCAFLPSTYDTCLTAPLLVGSTKIGALCAARNDGKPFNDSDSRSLTLLANSAAIAISNAQLRQSSEEIVRETAVLNERDRIAIELHDNIAQILSFCNLKIEQIQSALPVNQTDDLLTDLQTIKSSVETAHTQIRVVLHDLKQPPASLRENFVQELTTLIDKFRHSANLKINLGVSETAVLDFSVEAQHQTLLIIREALNNTHRHAQASSVNIQVVELYDKINFIIKDDGRGFSEDCLEQEGHYGLSIMRERAYRSGGRFTLDSAPGQGTTIILSYPRMSHNKGQHLV